MYRSSTVNYQAAPAPYYIRQVLEPDMINVGWVKVSSNITVNAANATNTWLWDVMMSPNNINQIGKDWFIALGWDNYSNTNVVCSIFEVWNVGGSNQCSGYPPGCTMSAIGTVYPANTNGWCNVYSSTLPVDPVSNCGFLQCAVPPNPTTNALSNSQFTYFQSVTIDRVIMMTSNTNAGLASQNSGPAYYIGTYDSFMGLVQDPYPICAINLGVQTTTPNPVNGPVGSVSITPNTIVGFTTREPTSNITAAGAGWIAAIVGGLSFVPTASQYTLLPYDFYSNKYIYTRPVVMGKMGGMRGLLKDSYLSGPSLPMRGDTAPLTINGVPYKVVFVPNNNSYPYQVAISGIIQGMFSFLQI